MFFFIVLPIMAGGVGEGAIPLSMGYAALMHMEQGVAPGRVLPMVMLGSLAASSSPAASTSSASASRI